MSIRAPHALPARPPKPKLTPYEFALGLGDIQTVANDLRTLKARHEEEHQAALEKIAADHKEKMAELDTKIAEVQHLVVVVHKGDPGKDAPLVDEKAIEENVLRRIPKPKDGITPVVDHDAIAAKAATIALGKIPKVKDGAPGKDADPKEVAGMVIDILKKDKPIKMEHIDGLVPTIDSYRAQLAGKHYGENTPIRGGGDVVTAGSNITITTDANGKKVIAATSGGFSTLQSTESPDGSRTTFTFALATAQPTFLVIDGVQKPPTSKAGTVLWTWNNGTKVATVSTPPNDDIYAIV